MAVTDDILATWRHPRRVMRRMLSGPPREDRALAILLVACVILFVAQWPWHSRMAHLEPVVPLDARLAGALMGSVFLLPLLAYAVAGLSHLAARAFGGRGSYYRSRVALFWALLAVSPVMLLNGLVAGFLGSGVAQLLVSLLALAIFGTIWGAGLRVAEFEGGASGAGVGA